MSIKYIDKPSCNDNSREQTGRDSDTQGQCEASYKSKLRKKLPVQRIKEDKLTEEDYIELCRGLVHVPEDEEEVMGTLSSLDRDELIDIFGPMKTIDLLSLI